MEVSYELTEDDYRHGLVAWRDSSAWRRWSYRIVLAAWVLGAVLSTVALLNHPDPQIKSLFWVGLGGSIAFVLAVWLTPRLQARMQFRRMPSAQGVTAIEASDSGMRVRSQHSDAHVAWPMYIGWAEGKSVFVVFPQPRTYVPIPKRAFTEEQLGEFREILRRNVVPHKKSNHVRKNQGRLG